MLPAMTPMRLIRPLLARPSLATGFFIFVVGMIVLPYDWRWSSRAVLSWDSGVFVTIVLLFRFMSQSVDADAMAKRSDRLDEGRGAVLWISLIGAVASIAAVCAEMLLNKADKGQYQYFRILVMIVTVALSWTFTQLVFAVHYAHDYYMPANPPERLDLVKDRLPPPHHAHLPYRGGLVFPGGDKTPDYWDFVHFSMVIGVACATADVNIESKAIRRLATGHGVIAFMFNAMILGLTINLSASLF